ncbi:MAG: sulfatase-like hydrolase/transferase, partial [Actinomycetota bacterium]
MTTEPRQPYNILFILTDQERHFRNQPDGVDRPGLRSLQRIGVTFEHHNVCSVACSPSRSNIYTGQHIVHSGIFDNVNFPWQRDLSTKIPTMGDLLRQAGYHAAYKGKWHLTKKFERELKEGMKSLSLEKYGFSDFHGLGDETANTLGGYQFDGVTAASAVNWLRREGGQQRREGKPWLLAVNLVNPHDIMYFNADDDNVVQGSKSFLNIAKAPEHAIYDVDHEIPLPDNWNQPLDEPGRPAMHDGYMKIHDVLLGHIPPDDEARWRRYQNYYFNCLRDMDTQVARLLAELEALDLLDTTVIVYTSDHGELGGAHGMRGKGNCAYREQNNVPLVIAHPDAPGGTHCRALTSHIDLIPTMLGFADLSPEDQARIGDGLPGHDLGPVLHDPTSAQHDAVRPGTLYTFNMLSYIDPRFVQDAVAALKAGRLPKSKPRVEDLRGAVRSIFNGRYRYSRYFFPRQHNTPTTLDEILRHNDIELFDLDNDPHENNNLATDPTRHKDVIESLNETMNALIEAEIGEDHGQMLPLSGPLSWTTNNFDM